MACGVPIVGSRSGSMLEIVDEGRTGFLATPFDANSFADAIERLGTDKEMCQKMGRHALEHVRKEFTVGKAVAETIRVYESLWS